MGAYKGKASTIKEAEEKTNGFKKGGKTIGKMGGGMMYEKGGKVAKKADMKAAGVMSEAHAGRAPRKSGGGVFSSAASGTPRGKSSHY
jgi:hypothetical protein